MKLVFFHSNCNDGVFSAAVFFRRYGKDAMYIPMGHGKQLEDTPEKVFETTMSYFEKNPYNNSNNSNYSSIQGIDPKTIDVFYLDYAFPIPHVKYHMTKFKSVTVYDHHPTALAEYMRTFGSDKMNFASEKSLETNEVPTIIFHHENLTCVFSQTMSGAKLVWRELFPDTEVPHVIELVSDRDTWEKKYKETDDFFYGIRTYKLNKFDEVWRLVENEYPAVLRAGEIVGQTIFNRIRMLKNAITPNINIIVNGQTYRGCFINSQVDIASDLCNFLIRELGYDIVVSYSIVGQGDVKCSVRSKKEIDSTPISLKFNGGGHASASGFSTGLSVLMNILTKKELIV